MYGGDQSRPEVDITGTMIALEWECQRQQLQAPPSSPIQLWSSGLISMRSAQEPARVSIRDTSGN